MATMGEKEPITVILKLECGINLVAADSNGYSDPYCKIKSASKTKKSRIIKKTLNPEWNESYVVQVKEELKVTVYDEDKMSKDDFLGELILSREQIEKMLEDTTKTSHCFPLQRIERGKLRIGLSQVTKRREVIRRPPIEKFNNQAVIEAGPILFLVAALFISYLVTLLLGSIATLVLAGGYLGAWLYTLKPHKENQARIRELERTLWDEHYSRQPHIESVDWINSIFNQVWIRHGESLSNYSKALLNPQLEYNKPTFLSRLAITSIDLGDDSPILENWTVTQDPDNNNRLSVDFAVRWKGDMKITLATNVFPVGIDDIMLQCLVRINLEYSDVLPFIKTVGVSVLKKPTITFELRPLKGVDVTALPHLSGFLNDLIHGLVIEQMLLYPKEFVYSLEEGAPVPQEPVPVTAECNKKRQEAFAGIKDFMTSVKIPKSIKTPAKSK